MSDIAGTLLAQYYGFSKNLKTERSLSIHECASNAENEVHGLIDEHSTADTNNDDTPKETEIQANDVKNEESSSETDIIIKSSRALEEWEASDDNEDAGFDIIFEIDTADNLVNEDTSTRSSAGTRDVPLNTIRTTSSIPSSEDNEENDSYISLSKDALLDSSISDVSSIAEKKELSEFSNRFASPFAPLQDKTPTFNETFVDLASTGLVSVPIGIIKKYFTIRMLYLENNNLTEVPRELFVFLSQLQWLDIRNNQLTSLPTSIRSHPSLETILLEGNQIEELPVELCLVPKLKILNVAHNPIIIPPRNIIALGCSNIINYLRNEWNKLHPDEPVKFKKQRIEPKLSTILCYQSPREKRLKLPKILQRTSKSANDISDLFASGISTRKRSRAYKPSNRCNNKGINFAMEQRMHCISKARGLLNVQSATIQKIKDAESIKEWRRDKRSFSKSMEKVSRRNEDDIPFAIEIESYPEIQKRQKAEKRAETQTQRRLKFTLPININKKLLELSKSLQKLEITEETLTPKTTQKYLHATIEKLTHFQEEIRTLSRYNEMLAPMNSLNRAN